MKKKLVLIFIFVLSLFLITGCTKNQPENKETNTKEEQKEEKSTVKVGEYEYDLSLTENTSFQSMKMKIPEGTVVNSLGTYTIYAYPKKGEDTTLFKIGITSFSNKTVEQAMGGSSNATLMGTKTINGIDWIQYEVDGKNHTYAYEYNKDAYTISFMYDDNLGTFEEDFMNTISFE